ncbi:MAG TPA: methionyl-tRNA formyltransferase, partial [Gammaproteobacteria bacterium]
MPAGLSVVFAGTPAFAVPALEAIAASRHALRAVFTQPDRPAGRGRKLDESAVRQAAERLGLPVEQPATLKDPGSAARLARHRPDVMVVAAYGLLLPQAVLDVPGLGCLNIHASLLPRWRGAAPIQRALLAGDTETGISIMRMEA